MIRTCDKNTFDAYADYFYQLAQNKKNAAFPLYCDGVKTKEDYLKTVYQSFEREDEDLLIYEKDGKVQGLFQIFFIKEDRYSGVQFAVVKGDFAEALQELLKIISEKYDGFTFNVYLPEESESVDLSACAPRSRKGSRPLQCLLEGTPGDQSRRRRSRRIHGGKTRRRDPLRCDTLCGIRGSQRTQFSAGRNFQFGGG